MTYKQLTLDERGKIEAWLFDRVPIVEIAKRLGRHRSTIHRELKRNSEERKPNSLAALPYQAISANNLTMMRKAKCGTDTKATSHNVRTILKYLNMKWSPEQIAHGVKSVSVCTNTIYNWIYRKIIPFDWRKLRLKGKRYKRKNRGNVLRRPDSSFFNRHSIDKRPKIIEERKKFGH